MSHMMTALAMKQRGLKPAAKILLYWLADHFNGETGLCCPSVETLAEECQISRATVFRYRAELESAGLIVRASESRADGGQGQTSYSLNLGQPPVSNCDTPRLKLRPPPVSICDHNLVSNNLGKVTKIKGALDALASAKAAHSFRAYRQRRQKPLTPVAEERLAAHLRAIVERGGDADDALGLAEERGWLTIKPEWYWNEQGQRLDAGLDQILRITGLAETPRAGGV